MQNKNVDKQTNIIDFVSTYYLEGMPETYNRSNDKMQCTKGKRRSFEDLTLLIKDKFPESSEEDLYKNIFKIKDIFDEIQGKQCFQYFSVII